MMADNEIIAHGECGFCSNHVEIKLNKNGKAYYFCSMCAHHEKWGSKGTEEIKGGLNHGKEHYTDIDNNDQGAGEGGRPERRDEYAFEGLWD